MSTSEKQASAYVDWIEKAISKNYINYYDHSEFTNAEVIENRSFGKMYRANWKGTDTLFAIN